jgi:hypothetical protein
MKKNPAVHLGSPLDHDKYASFKSSKPRRYVCVGCRQCGNKGTGGTVLRYKDNCAGILSTIYWSTYS